MEIADNSEGLIETLTSRGWCFRDLEEVKATIMIQSAILGEAFSVDSLESELANMDLRSIGAKSLPDPSDLRKSSHLAGPKVLQISSVRDVCRSSAEYSSGNSHNQRLLRLNLTDGHSEITAVEFVHIPSIPDDVVPGTKVRLQSKAAIRNSIVCLNPKVVNVLGGVVQSLYEEWQMNQKYSGLLRSTMRTSQEGDNGGPPPFEKLQIGSASHQLAQYGRRSYYSGSTSGSTGPIVIKASENSEIRQMDRHLAVSLNGDDMKDLKKVCPTEKTEEKTSNSEEKTSNSEEKTSNSEEKTSNSDTRPKEVAECIPIQNQAASQKLLQKLNDGNQNVRQSRGRRYRGKEKQEEVPTLTLAEWEKRKAEAKTPIRYGNQDISPDEALARQLQNQFYLEHHAERGPQVAEADNIKMSMFSYERDGQGVHGAEDRERGRGRRGGAGRGGGGGRGRGKRRGR